MGRAGITRYRWRFDRGPATFEAIFIMGTGDEPWELLLGAIGTDFAITLLVQRGFLVEAELPNPDYRALCRALQLNFDQNNHFKPTDFPVAWNEFQRLISLPLNPRMTADDVHDVVDAVRDIARINAAG